MNQYDIFDMINILIKRKKTLAVIFFIFFILSSIYIIFSSYYYESNFLIQPLVSPSSVELSSLKNSQLSKISKALTQTETDIEGERLISIINSRPFLQKIITKFDLYSYYKLNNKNMNSDEKRDLVLKKMRSRMITSEYLQGYGFLDVRIKTKDKYLSSQIANFIITELDNFNKYDRKSKAKESKILIESRLKEIQNNINKLDIELNKFRIDNKIADIEEQIKSSIKQYVELESNRIKKNIEIEILLKQFNNNDPRIISIKSELEIIKKEMDKLENSENSNYILSLNKIPDLNKNEITLNSQLEINKLVYESLFPQYEFAKIDEAKGFPTLEIIEDPVPSGDNPFKKKIIFLTILLLIGFFNSTIYVLFSELFILKRQENPSLNDKLISIHDVFIKKH